MSVVVKHVEMIVYVNRRPNNAFQVLECSNIILSIASLNCGSVLRTAINIYEYIYVRASRWCL